MAIHYCGYTSLEVKGWQGLLFPPCLLIMVIQATREFESSISVEALLTGGQHQLLNPTSHIALWFIKCPFMEINVHKLIYIYLIFYLTCRW